MIFFRFIILAFLLRVCGTQTVERIKQVPLNFYIAAILRDFFQFLLIFQVLNVEVAMK